MIKLKKKYVIGTHVMWFEIEMFKDFIDGLINLMDTVENKENVDIDLCFNLNQKLEKIDEDMIDEKDKIYNLPEPETNLINIKYFSSGQIIMMIMFFNIINIIVDFHIFII